MFTFISMEEEGNRNMGLLSEFYKLEGTKLGKEKAGIVRLCLPSDA